MIRVVDRVPTFPNRIKITREDGTSEYVTWERADEPTVVGTPINKALFDSIAADMGLSSNITIYVSNAGSDTLGNGTATNKYATIQKALNSLPRNLNGYDATINIAAGTYNEDVYVSRTFGGAINFDGTAGAAVNIRSLRVVYGAIVQVQNINLNVTGSFNDNAVSITEANLTCISSINITGGANNGLVVGRNGFFCAYENLVINNTVNTAINVTNHSHVYGNTISGTTASGTFLRSVNGSLISYNTFNGSAPTNFVTSAGGRIYTGAQTAAPNY